MTPLFDIAITLSMLGLLVAAVTLTKNASNAAASILFSVWQHIRREVETLGRQAKREKVKRARSIS
jgi:hypothetical protein